MTGYVEDPARLGETRLPDGRLLGWAEWGPPDGTPVLLCPGAATSRRLGFGPDAIRALGVRLISADRPGLGASTPAPGRTFADFAHDIRHLAELRELGRPAVVGNSQGAPFALACAAEGVVSGVAVVSGADEIAAEDFAAALPAEVRELVERVAADPAGTEEFFAGFDPDAMLAMVTRSSPACDLAVYQDPAFAAAYRRALEEGFGRGSASGYARDTLLAMGRWPFALEDVTVPVDVWYGDLDTSHSPDHGRHLTARIPDAHRHTVPDAGGSLLWTHPAPILTSLLTRTGRVTPHSADRHRPSAAPG